MGDKTIEISTNLFCGLKWKMIKQEKIRGRSYNGVIFE